MIVNSGCFVRLAALLCLATVASALVTVPGVYALGLENVVVWKWTSDTYCVASAVADVDGDGSVEIVTGGFYNDLVRDIAQLCVWSGSTLALEQVTTWYWIGDTHVISVAVGDVDGDTQKEIITGGSYYDGTRSVAQLCVWSGSTLALEQATTWYWTSHTYAISVAVGDVDGDQSVEIVTGGWYFDGTGDVAQLCVWSGSTLALEQATTWYWTSTTWISSVAIGDVDSDSSAEIVTGGYYNDGTRMISQLCVWSGSTLALEQVTTWYWTSDTGVSSVAIGDVDGDVDVEIVTGGAYSDGVIAHSQLAVWDGGTLALEDVTTWLWAYGAVVSSVAIGDVDVDQSVEIVTGGRFYDGVRANAQLAVWNGATLAFEDVTTWYWIDNTWINSLAVGNVDADNSVEIATCVYYYDNAADVVIAQLAVWATA